MNQIIHGDSLEVLKTIEDESVDLLCTDPPYGYSFMGKAWDKALPDVEIFHECFRTMKPGAFAFVMSAPRSDVCARMMLLLEEAGFNIAFTPIYWTYASGFPKAMNIGKMVDKRDGSERQIVGKYKPPNGAEWNLAQAEQRPPLNKWGECTKCFKSRKFRETICECPTEPSLHAPGAFTASGTRTLDITTPTTDAAKALDGSYGGFQPKPAVEVVIVAMKPLSEKTYVDQALKNGKGITWLDDCRVPTAGETLDAGGRGKHARGEGYGFEPLGDIHIDQSKGRFPANLLVEGDVLVDHSRFFSLDAWAQTLPFLAVPKASKSEKNKGLGDREKVQVGDGRPVAADNAFQRGATERSNSHPTVKPIKLMGYLITLGSRPGDIVLDPFLGSGTTAIAAKELGRQYIGIEREAEYHAIAEARLLAVEPTLI